MNEEKVEKKDGRKKRKENPTDARFSAGREGVSSRKSRTYRKTANQEREKERSREEREEKNAAARKRKKKKKKNRIWRSRPLTGARMR